MNCMDMDALADWCERRGIDIEEGWAIFNIADGDDDAHRIWEGMNAPRSHTLYGHEFDDHSYWIGRYYELPTDITWEYIGKARKGLTSENEKDMAPLCVAPGCVAWGVLLPSNYHRINV